MFNKKKKEPETDKPGDLAADSLETSSKKKSMSAEKKNLNSAEADQDNLSERLDDTKKKIVGHELRPADTKGLNPAEQAEAEKIETEAKTDLSDAKKKSLSGLQNIEKVTFTGAAVDVTSVVKSRAYNAASEAMTASKEELGGGWKGWKKLESYTNKAKEIATKVWKYNYLEQYYHQQAKLKAKGSILEEGNIYASEALSDADKKKSNEEFRRSTLARFTADAKDELVEEKLGEKREELKAETEAEKKIKADLKKIINDYADGRIDEAAFEDAKRSILSELDEYKKANDNSSSGKKEKYEKTELYVDNFLEIAENVRKIKDNIRQAQDHQEKLAQFDFDINLVLGKAKEGVKTETHYNSVDRAIENIRRTKLGGMMNETVLATSVALASSAVSAISQRVARSKALAWGTLGLSAAVAGLYSGLKENQMQKRERQTMERRSAVNAGDPEGRKTDTAKRIAELKADRQNTTNKETLKSIDKELKGLEAGQKKEDEKAKFIYDKEKATDLQTSLAECLYEQGPNGQRIEKNLDSAAEREKLLYALADIEARLELSNERKIDLISYSDLNKVETERLNLLVMRAEAKTRLVKLSDASNDYSAALKSIGSILKSELIKGTDSTGGLDKKDQEFNKYKNKAVVKKVVMSAITGLTVGVVAQEAMAFFSDKAEGLVENLIKGNDRALGYHDTVLQHLLGHHSSGSMHLVPVDHGMVKLPSNCDLVKGADGSFSLMHGSELVAGHLTVNGNGGFTEEAKQILAENQISLNDNQYLIEAGKNVVTHTSGPEDYISKHKGDFHDVSRTRFYGNDTEMYRGSDGKMHGADLNELRAHWGGDHGTGIDAKNNTYVMSAIKMQPDGSFQTVNGTRLSENATQLIKDGKMKFLFSLSKGTQHQVIELAVDPKTGNISVDRGSELGKMLFSEHNGQAVLEAQFAEVATVSGVNASGAEQVHVFATAVGKGLKDIISQAEGPATFGTNTNLDIPRDYDLMPIIPINNRNPLEKVPKRKPGVREILPMYYPAYYGLENSISGGASKIIDEKIEERRSDTLRNNPKAVLDHYLETEKYFQKADPEYFKQIKALANEIGPMGSENKLSVCIPVAGHQEGAQIYESLKNYTYQTASPDNFEICLFVNHPDFDKQGNPVHPDQTLAEIERFKKDYPAVNVKVIYQVIPIDEINIGSIRKTLNDTVLYRHHQRGEKASDLIMVSNDADNYGVDPRYVQSFINEFEKNPKLDGIGGQLDWDPAAYVKYPLIHIGTRLFQYCSSSYRINNKKHNPYINSSGASFAFKSSIYAGIGGYLDDVSGAEDSALGQAIFMARGKTYETQDQLGSASRLFTSARRAINVLIKNNLAPVLQWSQGFSVFDDEIRRTSLKDLAGDKVDYTNPEYLAKLKDGLEQIINQTLTQFGVGGDHKFATLLGRLGIQYEVDSKKNVVITDMSKLVEGLAVYQQEGVLQRKARSGEKGAAEELKKIRQPRLETAAKKKLEAEKIAAREAMAAEAATEEVSANNDVAMSDFYTKDQLNFPITPDLSIVKPLEDGEDTTDIDDDYVRRDQAVISDTENGKVYAGYNKKTKSPVVIKETSKLGPNKIALEEHLETLKFSDPTFFSPLKKIESDNKIMRVYEAAETDLQRYLEKQTNNQLPPKEALSVVIRLSNLVRKLNKLNIVLRDEHPGNIYLFKDGAIKLGDLDDSYINDFTKKGSSGNRFMMAPELFADEKGVTFDKTVDTYALSCSLYRMLVGHWPYSTNEEGMSPEAKQQKYKELHEQEDIKFPDGMSESIRSIIKKGLAVKPGDRYQNAEYFLQDLLRVYHSFEAGSSAE